LKRRSTIPDKPRFTGHRVVGISFKKGWVECDCDEEFTVKIEPELPVEIGHNALAAAFAAHRKAEAVKASA
jgi:hypothetical protein